MKDELEQEFKTDYLQSKNVLKSKKTYILLVLFLAYLYFFQNTPPIYLLIMTAVAFFMLISYYFIDKLIYKTYKKYKK